MNKYQEALNNLKNMGDKDLYNERHLEWADTLQELVKKATPENVLNKHKEYCFPSSYRLSGLCPNCKNHVDESKYCSRCGQKLDWREEDE